MKLRYIPIPELGVVWPVVRQHIQRANDKLGERWTPEEYYHALRQNLATLYLTDNGDGVVVAQKTIEMDGTIACHIWLVVGDLAEQREALQQEFEALAKTIGASKLRMRSPRIGWERASKGYWQVAEYVYEHDLRGDHAVQLAA